MQQTHYPDPDQLVEYAGKPMPLHEIISGDLELTDNDFIRVEYEHVEYRYRPTHILVEAERDEYEHVEDLDDYDLTHRDAWDRGIDVQIEEDFICISEFVVGPDDEHHQFDAYWLLNTVTITHPESVEGDE